MHVLVTGGAGFIGSHLVRRLLWQEPDWQIVNLDKLTYAGDLSRLEDLADYSRYRFVRGDIADRRIGDHFREWEIDAVANLAAESHVDRSISGSRPFLETDVLGTHSLLEAARQAGVKRFVQVSTDEVYGDIEAGAADEETLLRPSNPYAASKASADLLCLSYRRTYGVPVVIARCVNNYGPWQYPEKIIPLFITNLLLSKRVPMYGDGQQRRCWLHVEDHCAALHLLLKQGEAGQVYNVGPGEELSNLELTRRMLELMGKGENDIERVTDRPGHDRRYAVHCEKLRALGWNADRDFAAGLEKTVEWYVKNRPWWERRRSGEFEEFYQRQYPGL